MEQFFGVRANLLVPMLNPQSRQAVEIEQTDQETRRTADGELTRVARS
jgi:hypothetical protein